MRNYNIDLLRCVGLLMIIVAHLDPSSLLFQLRNFDVPLMVLVSGISFGIAHRPGENYLEYVWKRFKRLILPVWTFLTLYFGVLYLLAPENANLTLQTILQTYGLFEGIGFVWIIRVFLLVALIAPLLYNLDRKVGNNRTYLFLLFATAAAYHPIVYLGAPYFGENAPLSAVGAILFYVIPYGFVFAIGIRMLALPREVLFKLAVGFGVIFLLIAAYLAIDTGGFVQTQEYKYPSTIYYLSYALTVSIGLWLIADRCWNFLGERLRSLVLFLSYNSIWLYLWHIPFVQFADRLPLPFVLNLLLTVTGAIGITLLQGALVNRLLLSDLSGKILRNHIKIIVGVVMPEQISLSPNLSTTKSDPAAVGNVAE